MYANVSRRLISKLQQNGIWNLVLGIYQIGVFLRGFTTKGTTKRKDRIEGDSVLFG